MEGNFNLESMFGFLQAACKSKQSMEQITLQQIKQAGQHMRLLKRLNEKGLLIFIIAKLLHHKFNQFPQTLRLFQLEMFPVERATRMRRIIAEDGERKRRKKRTKKVDIDLNELSNESLTNPAGVLPPAGESETRGQDGQDQESKNSKNSKPPSGIQQPLDTDFRQAFTDMEHEANRLDAGMENGESSMSSSTSSNVSKFGAIIDYQKKMQIIGDLRVTQRTVRRPRAPPGTGIRTRRKEPIVDVKIDLDETGPTIGGQSLNETMEILRTRHGNLDERAKAREFHQTLENFQKRIADNIFSEANKHKLARLAKKIKEQRPLVEQHVMDTNQDFTDYTGQTSYLPIPDSTVFEEPDSTYREYLETNIFRDEKKLTLTEVAKKAKKNKVDAFYNLLCLQKDGTVYLQQANPERFGEIIVEWTKVN